MAKVYRCWQDERDAEMNRETAYTDEDNIVDQIEYRIVAIKRGDCIRGYRVQRGFSGVWTNKGSLQYTIGAAREFKEFLIRRDDESLINTIEVVE